MAVTVTDQRTIKDQADSTTGWVAAGGTTSVALGTADPAPVEATGHIASTASNATTFVWHAGTSLGTGPHLIYVWILTTGVLDTRANGGLMFLLGDGTNRVGYHMGGADVALFRSDAGEAGTRVGYMCMVLDTGSLPTFGATVQAGSQATLESNLNAITEVGAGFKTLAKAVGGAVNIWVDIIRHGLAADTSTSGITITGGTSGDPGKFSQIAVVDRDSADQKAHGIIRELGEGLFGVQGTLRFGDQGTGSSWFEDKNVTVALEKRGLNTSRYKIVITDNGTGTTTFKLGTKVGSGTSATGGDGCILIVPTGVGGLFDAATDTDVTDVFIYGSTFTGFTNGIKLRTGHEFIGCTVNASGTIEAGGATMVNTKVAASTATRALLWDVNTDTDTKLDGISFTSGGTGHAIELGSNTPSTITFSGIKFSSYGANDTTDAALYNNSGKAITINITNSGDTPTVRNGAGASTTVQNTVTLEVNSPSPNFVGARVRIHTDPGGVQLMNEEAINDAGVFRATEQFNFTGNQNVIIRARKKGFLPFETTGTITSAGLTVTAVWQTDTIAD